MYFTQVQYDQYYGHTSNMQVRVYFYRMIQPTPTSRFKCMTTEYSGVYRYTTANRSETTLRNEYITYNYNLPDLQEIYSLGDLGCLTDHLTDFPSSTYSRTHLSGLIGTASHSDKQKIRISGFFLENRLHWLSKVEKKKILQKSVLGHIFIYVQIKD